MFISHIFEIMHILGEFCIIFVIVYLLLFPQILMTVMWIFITKMQLLI